MSPFTSESTVALEHLDDYLKAIVKVKIREFVHLSPWFQDIPSIDVNNYMRFEAIDRPLTVDFNGQDDCPNRFHNASVRRRRVTRNHAI